MKFLNYMSKRLAFFLMFFVLAIIVFFAITKHIFKPIEFSENEIILSKKQLNKRLKANLEIKIKAENEIKTYIQKIDSIYLSIDSINTIEKSSIRELQRFFNNY